MVKSARNNEVNNINAQLSTGPGDTSRTRLNALVHGILSKEVIIGHGDAREKADVFEELKTSMTTDLAPVGSLEELLVDQLITLSWRWRRVILFETAAIRSKANTIHDDSLASLMRRISTRDPEILGSEVEELNRFLHALETEDPIQAEPNLWEKVFDVADDHDVPIEEILTLDTQTLRSVTVEGSREMGIIKRSGTHGSKTTLTINDMDFVPAGESTPTMRNIRRSITATDLSVTAKRLTGVSEIQKLAKGIEKLQALAKRPELIKIP